MARGGGARPEQTLDEWGHWVRSRLGFLPGYERQIVVDDLFGTHVDRRYISGLFKLGGGEAAAAVRRKIKNAAWDLFHLRMVDGHSTLEVFPGGPTYAALVTRDADILSLRERSSIVGASDYGGTRMPVHLSTLPLPRQREIAPQDVFAAASRIYESPGNPGEPPDRVRISRALAEVETSFATLYLV